MPGMVLKPDVVAGVLHARLGGDFSLAEARRTFVDILEAAHENGCDRILVDARGLSGRPKLRERFQYAEFAANAVATVAETRGQGPLRFAYVMTEPLLDAGRIGETVAENRGMQVKAFEEFQDAVKWLASPDKPRRPRGTS